MLADDVKLKQIVLNILSNAVKFTPEGGRVTVRAWVENNDDIAIQVCDTGIGIEAKNIARALEPFRQIEASTRDQSEGTGLGLPLANLLTKLHDGVFDLQSQFGKGTTVSLRFPAARNMLQRAGSVL